MPSSSAALLGRGLAALSLAALTIGCAQQGPTTISTSYSEYNAQDGTFACEYPDGWAAEGKSGRAATWAKFTSGGSMIKLTATAAGSLMADAMGGKLVYAIIPRDGAVEDIVMTQARAKARRIIQRTRAHMALEEQTEGLRSQDEMIEELAGEIAREMPRDFWR